MVWTGNSNPVAAASQALETCDMYSVPNTSTEMTLLTASSIINIFNPSVDVYVNFRDATCTTSNIKIPAGGAFRRIGTPITKFTMLSSSGTASVNIHAN